MHYLVAAIDPAGLLQAFTVQASSVEAARSEAAAGGWRVLSVHQAGRGSSPRVEIARAGRGRFEARRFAEDLSALLAAGLSLTECITTLAARETEASRRSLYQPIERALQEGKPFSAALEANGQIPALLVATVKASEQTGDLAQSLRRYAEAEARVEAVRQRIVSASIYPAILLVVGLAVVVFLLGFVVPRFATLIDNSAADIPQASRLLMAWGKLVNRHFAAIATTLACGLGAAALALTQAGTRRRLMRGVARLPVIGGYVRTYGQNQFWQTSAMLIEGGIAAPQAFRTAARLLIASDRQRMEDTLARLESGQDLAQAFDAAGLVDAVGVRMLQVAQRTGRLDRALRHLAAFQGEAFERSLGRLTQLAEPLLMIGIGIVIGAVVVLMYMPIFDLASSIQ